MATHGQIIEGLSILSRYSDKGLEESLGGADHDIIYSGGPGEYMKPAEDSEDGQLLKALGWHVDSECDSWARFV